MQEREESTSMFVLIATMLALIAGLFLSWSLLSTNGLMGVFCAAAALLAITGSAAIGIRAVQSRWIGLTIVAGLVLLGYHAGQYQAKHVWDDLIRQNARSRK